MSKIALSPCPNDVFILSGLILKKVFFPFFHVEFIFKDIEELNNLAIKGDIPVIKASFGVWHKIKNNYQLLSTGSAMGFGTGPLLVAKKKYSIKDFNNLKLGVPGKYTTANLLFDFFYQGSIKKVFLRYDKIIPAILNDEIDMGILIHEGRFVFSKYNLILIEDLGNYWERKTKCPIPLGGFFIKRTLDEKIKKEIDNAFKESLNWAKNHKKDVIFLLKKYAQEMDEEVIFKHIEVYVNEYTENVVLGLTSIKTLCKVLKTSFNENEDLVRGS